MPDFGFLQLVVGKKGLELKKNMGLKCLWEGL